MKAIQCNFVAIVKQLKSHQNHTHTDKMCPPSEQYFLQLQRTRYICVWKKIPISCGWHFFALRLAVVRQQLFYALHSEENHQWKCWIKKGNRVLCLFCMMESVFFFGMRVLGGCLQRPFIRLVLLICWFVCADARVCFFTLHLPFHLNHSI